MRSSAAATLPRLPARQAIPSGERGGRRTALLRSARRV